MLRVLVAKSTESMKQSTSPSLFFRLCFLLFGNSILFISFVNNRFSEIVGKNEFNIYQLKKSISTKYEMVIWAMIPNNLDITSLGCG